MEVTWGDACSRDQSSDGMEWGQGLIFAKTLILIPMQWLKKNNNTGQLQMVHVVLPKISLDSYIWIDRGRGKMPNLVLFYGNPKLSII